MKALEKMRERRYASVSDLAADVRSNAPSRATWTLARTCTAPTVAKLRRKSGVRPSEVAWYPAPRFPELDLALLCTFLDRRSATEAMRDFRNALRARL